MKRALKSICCLALLISTSLILFACKVDTKILQTPTRIGLVNNEIFNTETNEYEDNFILVTVENKYASKYRFYITDSQDYEKIENYVSFDSATNYISINDYFNNKSDKLKTYHYFVQYLGSEKYKDSKFSEIMTYTPESVTLDAPYIQMVGKEIFWTKIARADKYEIIQSTYRKDGDSFILEEKEKVAEIPKDVFTYNFEEKIVSPYRKYSYKVIAKGSGFYGDSLESNELSYIQNIDIETPKNLKIEDQILSFDKVEYATSYSLYVDNEFKKEITTESVDISEYLTEFRQYFFSVQASQSDVLSYNLNERSDNLSYDHTTTLSAPTFGEISRNGENILISFSSVENATQYELYIYHNNAIIKTLSSSITNVNVVVTDLFETLTEDKTITIKVKAISSNNFIFDSEETSVDYIVKAGI